MPTVGAAYAEAYDTGVAGETLSVVWYRQAGAITGPTFVASGGGFYVGTYVFAAPGQYVGRLTGTGSGALGILNFGVVVLGLPAWPVAGAAYAEGYQGVPGETVSVVVLGTGPGSLTAAATEAAPVGNESPDGSGVFVVDYAFAAAGTYDVRLSGTVTGDLGVETFEVAAAGQRIAVTATQFPVAAALAVQAQVVGPAAAFAATPRAPALTVAPAVVAPAFVAQFGG